MADAQYEVEEDEKSVDLDVSETEETEIELKSSKKEDDSNELDSDSTNNVDEDDEHQEYSAGVKKRIDRLTKKMREAERQREEAVKYAQGVQSESEKIRTRMKALDQGYMTEYGSRLSMEQQQVESELKRAVEMGDSDATVAAQRKMTQLAVASDRYETTKQAQERSLQEQQQAEQYRQQQAQPAQPAPQQAPKAPDPKAENWASQNDWFGADEAMTFAAFGLHKRLVEDEGFDPTSNEYYSELDNRIRKEFPHKFKDSTGKRPVQNVAGSARGSTGRTGRTTKVKLTPSQVAIAKKLGVPLEEYAKYVK